MKLEHLISEVMDYLVKIKKFYLYLFIRLVESNNSSMDKDFR